MELGELIMKDYLEVKERGWFYFKDEYKNCIYRWDKQSQRIRIIDFENNLIVNDKGVPLTKVLKMIQDYK